MWTFTEAKSRFSEVAELALTRGPQEITVATKRPVVLIAKDELDKLAPGGVKEWPGLAVQTFGPLDEIVFRTKGIPSLFTHWWHFVRGASGDLSGIVLGTPDVKGIWRTCMLIMNKVQET